MTAPARSDLERITEEHGRRLRARESAAVRQMTRLYAGLAKDLGARATPLAVEVERRREAEDAVPAWQVRNLEGYTELTAAVEREVRQLVNEVTAIIEGLQRDGWRLGAEMADAQLEELLPAELRKRLTGT